MHRRRDDAATVPAVVSARVSPVARSLVSGATGMPVRQRRRVDAVLLAIAVLLAGAIAATAAMAGNSERVTGLWTSAETPVTAALASPR